MALVAVAPACGLNQEGVAPPHDHVSFPASAIVDPNGEWLYVVNSNADLRYNNGTLVVADLKAAAQDRADAWDLCPSADYLPPSGPAPGSCCWDFLDHSILDCDDRRYVASDQTIEIGSFGAGMAFQPFDEQQDDQHCGNPKYPDRPTATNRHECIADCKAPLTGDGRLFIGVRGNSSLTYVDVLHDQGTPRFDCPDANADEERAACKITDSSPTAALEPQHVPDEPYALTLDRENDLLYVGHLKGDVAHPGTGGVSLYDVRLHDTDQSDLLPPRLVSVSQAFFPPDVNGLFGVTSLTPRKQNGLIYATSRYGNTATSLVTTMPVNRMCADPSPPDNPFMVLPAGDTYATPLLGVEIRGIAFPPDTSRAFMLQRLPPALLGFDIANGTGGLFGNIPTDIIETCQAPTFLQQAGEGVDARLYITCFESGQVYVVDPFVPRLTNVIEVGRGPAGLAFAPPDASGKRLAYVVGFSANNISVVDLTPGSPTQFHVIQRLGFPSAVPR